MTPLKELVLDAVVFWPSYSKGDQALELWDAMLDGTFDEMPKSMVADVAKGLRALLFPKWGEPSVLRLCERLFGGWKGEVSSGKFWRSGDLMLLKSGE